MKCIKCGSEGFVLSTVVAVEEIYKIYKNGSLSKPDSTVVNEDLGTQDNVVRCANCNQEYLLNIGGRYTLLNEVDYSKIDLESDAILI